MTTHPDRSDAGFSLPEVLIAMGIMMVVLAGSFSAMAQAMKAEESTRLVTTMNSTLRTTMDLVVRDFLQMGQGLPDGRRIEIPNGNGAAQVMRPGPRAAATAPCAGVPALYPVEVSIPAVTVGANLGPAVNGVCTDVITMLAADGSFDRVALRAVAADGSSITVARPVGQPLGVASGVDIDDGGGDDVRVGDLIMLTKNGLSALMYISAVNGPNQQISFAAGDPFNLNQFDPIDADPATAETSGTINQLIALGGDPAAPALNANGTPTIAATQAARVRMITYFVRIDPADPNNPRLVRTINAGVANTVGFGVEAFNLSYDLVDEVNNWTNVQMTDADLAPGGACGATACSENLIRKVNVTLSMRSRDRFSQTREFMRNTLYSQVAVRSLAFVDRYR